MGAEMRLNSLSHYGFLILSSSFNQLFKKIWLSLFSLELSHELTLSRGKPLIKNLE